MGKRQKIDTMIVIIIMSFYSPNNDSKEVETTKKWKYETTPKGPITIAIRLRFDYDGKWTCSFFAESRSVVANQMAEAGSS